MSDRYMNARACGIEPETEGEEPTLEQWRDRCRLLWAENARLKFDIHVAKARIAELEAALKPFAAYADPHGYASPTMPITHGSSMAKRQIYMSDCYRAAEVLACAVPSGGPKETGR